MQKEFSISRIVATLLALGLACVMASPVLAQIPSGYVQTTATIPVLANGTYGASWTNLSSSPQLGLLGCVSAFQTTVNGKLDSNGYLSVLLADTAQICPAPSTWTFSFTFNCPTTTPAPGGFSVQVAVTGGGSAEDITAQITAALPSTPCAGGGGGGGGSPPGGPDTAVQVNHPVGTFAGYTSLTYTTASGLKVGGTITGHKAIVGNQSTMPADWIFDWTTPATALASLGGVPLAGTGASGTWTINISGNSATANSATTATSATTASTATALAGTPTNCMSGYAPTGILANGNATGCAVLPSLPSHSIVALWNGPSGTLVDSGNGGSAYQSGATAWGTTITGTYYVQCSTTGWPSGGYVGDVVGWSATGKAIDGTTFSYGVNGAEINHARGYTLPSVTCIAVQ